MKTKRVTPEKVILRARKKRLSPVIKEDPKPTRSGFLESIVEKSFSILTESAAFGLNELKRTVKSKIK